MNAKEREAALKGIGYSVKKDSNGYHVQKGKHGFHQYWALTRSGSINRAYDGLIVAPELQAQQPPASEAPAAQEEAALEITPLYSVGFEFSDGSVMWRVVEIRIASEFERKHVFISPIQYHVVSADSEAWPNHFSEEAVIRFATGLMPESDKLINSLHAGNVQLEADLAAAQARIQQLEKAATIALALLESITFANQKDIEAARTLSQALRSQPQAAPVAAVTPCEKPYAELRRGDLVQIHREGDYYNETIGDVKAICEDGFDVQVDTHPEYGTPELGRYKRHELELLCTDDSDPRNLDESVQS